MPVKVYKHLKHERMEWKQTVKKAIATMKNFLMLSFQVDLSFGQTNIFNVQSQGLTERLMDGT